MTCTTTCRPARGKQAHCTACHRTFGSVSGFDRHRRDGVCLDPADLPMRLDAAGVWRWEGRDSAAMARLDRSRARQSDERGPVVPRYTPGDSEPAESLSGGAA